VTVVQGRAIKRGDLVTRITVTSSIFNFSTRFSAQIVENRETQLSSPFLGHGDNFFPKSYDENQIWSERPRAKPRAWDLMHGRGDSTARVSRAALARGRTRSGFRHNFSKNCPQDLESYASRFFTICAKNMVLKLKIDEVTVIRVIKSPLLIALPCSIVQ
jgi:hypothetical protein